ncbi:MAG: hypothetical protein RQ741_02765 [Wenzhouxiangellaceae bacterium]|nr:hypothetical protein [Wenzhouxiangellaceae bacterium]
MFSGMTGPALQPVTHPALAALLIIVLGACDAPLDDEQRLLRTLDQMAEALEQGHAGDFMDSIADDFIAGNGGLDKRALRLLLMRERMARQRVRTRRFDTVIEFIGENRARAGFQALATGGTGLVPNEGQLWRIETGWRRDGDRWLLISADWTRAF